MRPNKARRNSLYAYALQHVQNQIKEDGYYHAGILLAIDDVRDVRRDPDPFKGTTQYPEIHRHRPEVPRDDGFFWEPNDEGQKKIVEALEQAIRDTAQNKP